MALDGILLHKVVPEIAKSFPLRIQKIWDISNTEILFQTHGEDGKKQLLISCHSVYNRILFSKRNYPTPSEPRSFVMVLRKYLEGSIMETIEQFGLDRWCVIQIRRRNNLGDIEYLKLYVELMGQYANMILVNNEGKIIDALKRIAPSETNNRIIHPGAMFEPIKAQMKEDPFVVQEINPDKSLVAQFAGFSPFLAKEVEYRLANGESFHDIMQEIEKSNQLFIANHNNEAVFHCIELKSCGLNKSYPFFEGFDILYYHKEEKERIKQVTGDIYHLTNRQLKHYRQKLPRLMNELDQAIDCDKYNKYGELLYTYNITDTKGQSEIILKDYESDSDIKIPLDAKLDGKQNAKKYYQKYKKLKKGQTYIQEQIDICNNEINYFEGILQQLEQADYYTAIEIKDELTQLGYIKAKTNNKKKAKKQKLSIVQIQTDENTLISIGKNNLQNDELTWHIAKRNEYWFHAKDYHGAHVILHKDTPSEDDIRLCAMLAAYYSKGRMSSSVPVNYCQVKNLKKIPGAKPGMVQLTNYKTIYIDPDEEIIQSLIPS